MKGTPRPNFQKVFSKSVYLSILLQKDVPIFVASWAHCTHLAGYNHKRNTFYEIKKIVKLVYMTNF